MTTLLVGFDSAWTSGRAGGIVGALQCSDGLIAELGPPSSVNFQEAEALIEEWQATHTPNTTIVLLDQPTIVENVVNQRPVENLVCSPIVRRRGGVQPAYRARREMFGDGAPVWRFLDRFGGPADPLKPLAPMSVFETYPVLSMIALGWMLPDVRLGGRLPKYNPARKRTFSHPDWKHVCDFLSRSFRAWNLVSIAEWIAGASANSLPRKSDQDRIDACLCLLVALHLRAGRESLMVGDMASGYIVVPYSAGLHLDLEARCEQTGREPTDWLRTFRLLPSTSCER